MKRILYILRIIIISPEFISVAIIYLLLVIRPTIFIWLSANIDKTSDMVKWIFLLPTVLTGLILKDRSELLSPGSEKISKIILNWPDYNKIEYRFWISLAFAILGSALCIWISVFGDLKNYVMMATFLSGIIISSISYLTFLSATITLKRIISTISNL